MGVFGALTAGVISVAPQHYLADLVQNAVGLFEIPGSLSGKLLLRDSRRFTAAAAVLPVVPREVRIRE